MESKIENVKETSVGPATSSTPPEAASDEQPDTAARLLEAADEVFAEQGFAGATTAAIARRAGVTKALVHYYFRTKESLFLAVMESYEQEVNALVLEDLDRGEPVAAITEAIRRYCAFLAAHPRYVRLNLFNALEGTCHRTRRPLFQKLIDETTAALRRGMEMGIFRREHPLHLLVSIDSLCCFFFEHEAEIRALWGEEDFDRERLVEEHMDHVIRMLMQAICTRTTET